MGKTASIQDIREMALVLINARDKEIELLEREVSQLKAMNKELKGKIFLLEYDKITPDS